MYTCIIDRFTFDKLAVYFLNPFEYIWQYDIFRYSINAVIKCYFQWFHIFSVFSIECFSQSIYRYNTSGFNFRILLPWD